MVSYLALMGLKTGEAVLAITLILTVAEDLRKIMIKGVLEVDSP